MIVTHGEGSGHSSDCFGCKVKTVQVSPAAMPTRGNPSVPPAKPQNSWERGRVLDSRGLPITDANGNALAVKDAADNRKNIEKRLKEVKDPNYWRSVTPERDTAAA
jgi:hypothetical protein